MNEIDSYEELEFLADCYYAERKYIEFKTKQLEDEK